MKFRVKIEEQGNADTLGVPLNSIQLIGAFEYYVITLHGEIKLSTFHDEAIKAVLVAIMTFAQKKAQERATSRNYDVRDSAKDQNYMPSKYFSDNARAKAESIVGSIFNQVATRNGKIFNTYYRANSFIIGSRLSQNKANELAKQGMNYIEILKYFYGDIEIMKMKDISFIGQTTAFSKRIASIYYLNGTVSGNGCGAVSTAMAVDGCGAYSGYMYYDMVKEVVDYSLKHGYKSENGTNINGLVPSYCATKGIKADPNKSWSAVSEAVKDGNIGVISVNNDDKQNRFTKGGGHIIVVTKYDGKYHVNNPNSIGYDNQGKTYTYEEIEAVYKYGVIVYRDEVYEPVFIPLKEGDKNTRPELTKEVQTMLTALGYNVGAIDGWYGNKSMTGVKAFKKVNGLDDNSTVDELTYKALKQATGSPVEPTDDYKKLYYDLKAKHDTMVADIHTALNK